MPIRQSRKPLLGVAMNGKHRSHPRYKGCVAHWLMAEGAGTKVRDVSGFGHDGTFNNMDAATNWVRGQFGPTLEFLSTSAQSVNIDDTILRAKTFVEISTTAWYKSRELNSMSDDEMIVNLDFNTADGWNMLVFDDSGKVGEFGIYNPTGSPTKYFSTVAIIDQIWHHVAVTRGKGRIKLYLDGLLTADLTDGMSATVSTGRYIGDSVGDTEAVDGQLDDIRIFDLELTANNVWSIFSDSFLEFRRDNRIFLPVAAAPESLTPLVGSAVLSGISAGRSEGRSISVGGAIRIS